MYRMLPAGPCLNCAELLGQECSLLMEISCSPQALQAFPPCSAHCSQALPGSGRGLSTEPASSFTPGERSLEVQGLFFSADLVELTACIMSKAAAREEFPLLPRTCFSATAACSRACDFMMRLPFGICSQQPSHAGHLFSAQPQQAESWHLSAHLPLTGTCWSVTTQG